MLDNKDLDSVESNGKKERERRADEKGDKEYYLRRALSSGWNGRASDLIKFENGLTNSRHD